MFWGDNVVEVIGVDVEEGNDGEGVELDEEVLDDISIVKVDANNDIDLEVVRCRGAKDVVIATNVKTNLITDEVVGVKVYYLLPYP